MGDAMSSFPVTATQQFLALKRGPRGSCYSPWHQCGCCFRIHCCPLFHVIPKTIKHDQLLNEITFRSPAGKTQRDHNACGYARNLEKGRLRQFLMLLNYPGLLFYKVQGSAFVLAFSAQVHTQEELCLLLRMLRPAAGASVGPAPALQVSRWRQGCPRRLAASEQSSFRELVTVGLNFFFLIMIYKILICSC